MISDEALDDLATAVKGVTPDDAVAKWEKIVSDSGEESEEEILTTIDNFGLKHPDEADKLATILKAGGKLDHVGLLEYASQKR
ncbi:MAG: hypothetical protein H0T78_06180 [Longispora sp.]|nr:hypothetical protein [Longispora sp. (in: high G+C Gram-positive bacteria)]